MTVFLSFYLIYIYGTIFFCDQQRINKAKTEVQSGAQIIEVENLPYGAYIWTPNPTSESVWEERFKLFYGISDDVVIENIDCHLK